MKPIQPPRLPASEESIQKHTNIAALWANAQTATQGYATYTAPS